MVKFFKEQRMTTRNFSPMAMFERMAAEHKPLCAFNGATKKDFETWKAEALPRVLATLGDWPGRVPLDPVMTAEWAHDGLTKQRWLIDVGPHISAASSATSRLPTSTCRTLLVLYCATVKP